MKRQNGRLESKDIAWIRYMVRHGPYNKSEIAEMYGVTRSRISQLTQDIESIKKDVPREVA